MPCCPFTFKLLSKPVFTFLQRRPCQKSRYFKLKNMRSIEAFVICWCCVRNELTHWHLADDIYKCIFLKEKFCILIRRSLKFVPQSPINDKSVLVQPTTWYQTGDKPLPESNDDWSIYVSRGPNDFIHCGLVMPYGIKKLCQYGFRQFLAKLLSTHVTNGYYQLEHYLSEIPVKIQTFSFKKFFIRENAF